MPLHDRTCPYCGELDAPAIWLAINPNDYTETRSYKCKTCLKDL